MKVHKETYSQGFGDLFKLGLSGKARTKAGKKMNLNSKKILRIEL